jgi:hypothetical protein
MMRHIFSGRPIKNPNRRKKLKIPSQMSRKFDETP